MREVMAVKVRGPVACFSVALPSDSGGEGGTVGGGGGAGAAATSSGGSTAAASALTMAPGSASSGLGTNVIKLTRKTADMAVNGPPLPIPAGYVVEISADPSNTKPGGVSMNGNPDAAKSGVHWLTPTSVPRTVRVNNLADIWWYGEVVAESCLLFIKRG